MNMNQSGIRTVTGYTPNSILFDVKNQSAVSVILANTGLSADADGKKILRAGTPITGTLTNRSVAFTKAATTDTTVKGVYTVQITTAFVADEVITIEGVAYTCKAAESVANKQFAAGSSAADQITSLLKMVTCADFVVAAVEGATDKLGFTQKTAQSNNPPAVAITASTGVIGAVTEVTQAVTGAVSSNAVGVLLHDVDVTTENANGTMLIFGFVNLSRLDIATATLIDASVVKALNMIKFLQDA
jgi:hypothetical protein